MSVSRNSCIGALALGLGACHLESDPMSLRYITSGGSADSGDDGGPDGPDLYDTPQVCGYHTQTQGGWGSRCHGANPGCYRDDTFEAAFPSGLTIGYGPNTMTLRDSLAVQKALPTGGPPRALAADELGEYDGMDDPHFGSVLVGQAVALALNLGFSGQSTFVSQDLEPFRQLVIADPDSPCVGMSVQHVLEAANLALGGYGWPLSPAEANACATLINQSFVDGDPECSVVYAFAEEPDTRPLRPISRPDLELETAPAPWQPPE